MGPDRDKHVVKVGIGFETVCSDLEAMRKVAGLLEEGVTTPKCDGVLRLWVHVDGYMAETVLDPPPLPKGEKS